MKNVVIVAAKRTPLGSFGGSLAGLSATELGASAILEVVKAAGVNPKDVQEVVFGNVLSAGIGQAPARQAALKAGLSETTPSTTVNKVCASGMKAIMIASDQIQLGQADIIVAGGMESMSNVPYYLPKHRFGSKLGHSEIQDGIIKDGLWDVYKDFHMGNAAELCAAECKISREDQDEYAITSYKRAIEAHEKGYLKDEIIKMKVNGRKGEIKEVIKDEELDKVNFDKIPSLRPVFDKQGTVTASNASWTYQLVDAVTFQPSGAAVRGTGNTITLTSSTIQSNNNTPFRLQITNATGCTFISTGTPVSALIRTLDIVVLGNRLTAQSSTGGSIVGRQWFRNGLPMINGTGTFINIFDDAEYSVEVYYNDGCVLTASMANLVLNTADAVGQFNIGLYPNPTNDRTFVKINGEYQGKVTIRLMTVTGQLLMEEVVDKFGSELSHEISLSSLQQGIYNLQVSRNGINENMRIIKK
jgi:hypothetical protein